MHADVSSESTEAASVLEKCDLLLEAHDPSTRDPVEFLGAQFDAGLAWVGFPVGLGGLGADPALQAIVDNRLRDAGAPSAIERNLLGVGMGAPTILEHGTSRQRARHLRPIFTGEELWCQLFSEPGAGSDMAAVATRAVCDGDEWVLNGQKVWTTLGHVAHWGMLIARTDPAVPKHRGLTYFLCDMRAAGVEVRPLYQMTGEAEFNEVYLTDARIPDSNRLGAIGEGWSVALTTLMNERVTIGGRTPPRESGFIGEATRLWRERREQDPALRDRLARLWIEAEVLRLTSLRAAAGRGRGAPGPEGSVGKAIATELNKKIANFAVDLLGAEGMLKPGGYPMDRPEIALMWNNPQYALLRSRANTIEGGTSEVMRNILGERVLGLPGDIRTDRDVPWNDVPR